jgi:hypothetical protein
VEEYKKELWLQPHREYLWLYLVAKANSCFKLFNHDVNLPTESVAELKYGMEIV